MPSLLLVLRQRRTDLEVTEALLEVMTLAAFDLKVALLLLDEMAGLAGATDQDPAGGLMEALPLYGVDSIFVERESWLQQSVSASLRPEIRLIERSSLNSLWARYDRLVTS